MNFFRFCLIFIGLVMAGCLRSETTGEARALDRTDHFWSYVRGDYSSSDNDYYIQLDPNTRTVEWFMPIKIDDKPAGSQCYFRVKLKIHSVSTAYPSRAYGVKNNLGHLLAKATPLKWKVDYTKKNVSKFEAEACEVSLFDHMELLEIETLYIPVLNYGPSVVDFGPPRACLSSSCGRLLPLAHQDFATQLQGTYRASKLPKALSDN